MAAKVSAIIRTRGHSEQLAACLDQLKTQSCRPQEIIVVDNSPDASSRELVKRHGGLLIHYPADRQFNHSHALNLGIEAAQCPLVLILSSHCLFNRLDSIASMADLLEKDRLSAVYLKTGPPEECTGPLDYEIIHLGNFDGYNAMQNPCSMIHKELWIQHRFSEEIPSCEDQEWALWHMKYGGLPTGFIRNPSVAYANPRRTVYKQVREELVIAEYFLEKNASLSSSVANLLRSIKSLVRGRWFQARVQFETAVAMPFRKRIIPKMFSDVTGKVSVLQHLFGKSL